MKERQKEEELMSVDEAAEFLGMNKITIGLLSLGSLIPLKVTLVGKRRAFTKSDLIDWAKRRDEAIADGRLSKSIGGRHRESAKKIGRPKKGAGQ